MQLEKNPHQLKWGLCRIAWEPANKLKVRGVYLQCKTVFSLGERDTCNAAMRMDLSEVYDGCVCIWKTNLGTQTLTLYSGCGLRMTIYSCTLSDKNTKRHNAKTFNVQLSFLYSTCMIETSD